MHISRVKSAKLVGLVSSILWIDLFVSPSRRLTILSYAFFTPIYGVDEEIFQTKLQGVCLDCHVTNVWPNT